MVKKENALVSRKHIIIYRKLKLLYEMSLKETIILELKNKEFLYVEGSYTPEEPMIMYHKDGTGHPGSPSEFEVDKIFYHTNTGKVVNITAVLDYIYDEKCDSWETFSDKLTKIFEESKE